MLNYIKSEFYRNINNKGNYIFLFGCISIVIFINVFIGLYAKSHIDFPYGHTKLPLNMFSGNMKILFILCVTLVSLIDGEEFKNHTLKNSIAYGISRNQIYLGKFLMEVIISTINLVLISSVYAIAAYLMLKDSGIVYLKDFIQTIVGSFPLLLVSLTAAHCFYFIFDNDRTVVLAWAIVMALIPAFTSMAGRRIYILNQIAKWMPWNMVGNAEYDELSERVVMSWSSQEGFIRCFLVGAIGVAIFYTLGLLVFKKKEIK